MSRRSIDYQGIVDLDLKVIEQLESFLKERESRLAYQILNTIYPQVTETFAPALQPSTFFKLSDAVEEFSKRVQFFIKNEKKDYPKDMGIIVAKEINTAFWEFTEMLESCVVELFQQIRQVPINRWHISLARVVQAVKDILIQRFDELQWALNRIEKPLNDFCQFFKPSQKKMRLSFFEKTYLDSNLFKNLNQTEKFLKRQYEAFHQQYNEYMRISTKVGEEDLERMKTFPILALLDISEQNLYVDVFRLLKMLELNRRGNKEINKELTRALKHQFSVDNVFRIFRSYFQGVIDGFFNSSLEWKDLNQEGENFYQAKERLQEKVKDYQTELTQLLYTLSQYRTFILKNDSNPYVSSRWGFTEWIVGPEPPKAKKLLKMIYSAEELNRNISNFSEALKKDLFVQQQEEYQVRKEIEKLLHEMGQPLISKNVMKNRAERLMKQLKICDEIGNPHSSIIYYFEDVLLRAMRDDWKYHVLHEIPLFHEIYRIHQGLSEYFEDQAHDFRLEQFRLLFNQIHEWVEKEDVYAHVHEIQLDINDMKTYLQDFLANVQRAVKEKSHNPFLDDTIHKFQQQLLEYNYLFGQFLLNITAEYPEGAHLRNQFLFVNQYFESVENLLAELKETWEGKV